MHTQTARRFITFLSICLMALSALFGATRLAAAQSAPPTIASHLADYNPGNTVILTGNGWAPGETVHIFVNDDVGQTWSHDSSPDPVADPGGRLTYTFQLPAWFVATYSVRASGPISGTATTRFTDPNASANIDQCANGQAPSPNTDGCSSSASEWVNGNLGASKAVYFEGDSVPYRLVFGSLSLTSHTVTIEWDTTKSGTHALDYLTTFNRTVADANPCLGVSGCNPATFTTFAIPADPQVTGGGVTPAAGVFTLYGGTITAVSAYSYPTGAGFAGDKSARISITFTAGVANPVLAWGGHISTRKDWGANNAAITISGSPYHTRLIDLDGSGGNQDLSLAAEAVIFPGSITIIKDATPNGATSFGFTGSPAPLAAFTLVDDGTTANTKVFSKITNFTTYTVAESTIPPGWGFDSASCAVTSPNGGAYSTSPSSQSVSINLVEGENWTCTFLDSLRTGTLTVKKHVVNDNGGAAAASAWSIHVMSGLIEVTGSPQNGSESGTVYSLLPGTYAVSETGGVSGYTGPAFSGDCDSGGSVTVVIGQSKTCTLTNNDQTAHLKLVKAVTNDNGGAAVAADWTLTATGGKTYSGAGGFDLDVDAGAYALSETGPTGYTTTGFDCGASVSLALGESKTCTITNDDQAATLIVNKIVVNDNGGTKTASDFSFSVNGGAPAAFEADGQNDLTVPAGTYSVTEPAVAGYTTTYDNCTSLVIPNGGSATCTITNDDQSGTLIVKKVVVNDSGGALAAQDFSFSVDGGAAVPFEADGQNELSVAAGTYTVSEPAVAGYSTMYDNCASVVVPNGGSATCTITNDDDTAHLKLVKVVTNDNGGAAVAADWTLTATGGKTYSGAGGFDLDVDAGAYTLAESGPAGYTTAGFDCGTSVTLALGESKTCTITNDDQTSHLTLIKLVTNDNGGTAVDTDWTLAATGAKTYSGAGGFDLDVDAGTYALSESGGPAGYSTAGFDCGTSVTLALGESKTCTITNDDIQPQLTVIKHVINDNGGTKTAGAFAISVVGVNASPAGFNGSETGTTVALDAGDYAVSETELYGYTASYSADCTGNVAVGDAKTCTITNDDQAATLIVKKIVVNDNGGAKTFTDFSFSVNGGLSAAFEADGQNDLTVDAGTYTITEPAVDGYTTTYNNCTDVAIPNGGSATCTITNDDQPGTLTVIKVVINDNGGILAAGDFAFSVNGGGAVSFETDGQNDLTVDAGTYGVTEDHYTGYTTTYDHCTGLVIPNGGSATCTITNDDIPPQLTIVKTADPAIANGGDAIAFTITVGNTGEGTARSVALTDTLPAGVAWTIDPPVTGCAITSGVLTCSFGDIAQGETKSVTVTGPAPVDCTTLSNMASAQATNNSPVEANVSIQVLCASIAIEKTTTTTPVSAGDPIRFTITVRNNGTGIARDVTVTDNLPANGGLSWDVLAGQSDEGCEIDEGVLTCHFGDINAGGARHVVIESPTTAATCGLVENTASASASNDGTGEASASITVQCPALQVGKIADAASASAGDEVGFTITVANNGAGLAKSVTLTDALPGGLDWAVDPPVEGCEITAGALTCNLGDLASGASLSVHVSAVSTPEVCGDLSNTATATPTYGDAATSPEATTTVLCPDVSVTKEGNGTISAGDTAIFTLHVKNTGLGEAKSVTLTDTLPAGVTWAIDPAVAGCAITTDEEGVQTLACAWDTLASGADISIIVKGETAKENCGLLANLAAVAAGNENTAEAGNNTAEASITVNCPAIAISKTAGNSPVNAGDAISFTILASNSGAGNAYDVIVTDTLPSNGGLNWTVTPDEPACVVNAGVLTCSFDSIPAGSSQTITLSSPTAYASCGMVNNTASVTTGNDGTGESSASITVQCPDLAVTKTADAAIVNAGDTIGFTITVTNNGDGLAKAVTLNDTLPTGTGIDWIIESSDPTCTLSDEDALSCDFGDLAKGESKTVHLTSLTSAGSCAIYNNTATASAGNQPNVTSPEAFVKVQCAAITIAKAADADEVSAGDTIGFTITVSNGGPGAAYGVTLEDTLPASAGLSWSIDGGSGAAQCAIAGGALTCDFGTMQAGDERAVHITSPTTAASCGAVANTASASTTNDGSGEAGAAVTVNCPDLTVMKTPDAGTVSAGDTIGFTITVKNDGAGKAYGASLSDTLPASAGTDWTIDPEVEGCAIDAGVLTCAIGTLDPGATFSVHLSSPTSPATCGAVDNTATASASNEADTGNNADDASITVNCPDVTVSKEAISGTINAGDTAAFKIVVQNIGAGTAYNVTLNDTLPAGVTWAIDPAVTGCAIDAGTLSCSFASLAAGASVEIDVSGTTSAAVCGKLDNTATVAASNEANTDNNSASASITVNCSDVTVTKEAVSSPISAGDTAAFKIIVTNNGAGMAYNVTLTDTLPAGVTWAIDPAVTGCAITSNILSCSFASLASGASVEIDVSGPTSAAVCGVLDNTATVAASNEADTSNNSASASITVNCSDVTVTKDAVSSPISAGDIAAFKIVVSNSGPGTAYNVTLNDPLPAGVDWTINPAVTGCNITGGTLGCTWATLASGASVEIDVSGPTTAALCGVLDNTATVAASNEANTGNNTDGATIAIDCPDVTVTKAAGKSPIHAGETAEFKIVVSNSGPGTAYGVTLADTLPVGVDWTIDPAVTGCEITNNTLSCAWATLATGESVEITVKGAASPAVCGTLDNTVSVAASNEPAGQTNNSANASIAVTCPADLTISKTADAAFQREFTWAIDKSADQTLVKLLSGKITVNYTVMVSETGFTDSAWVVAGKITVANPNDWLDIPLSDLTDAVDNGGTCTISGFTTGVAVPKSGSLVYDYTCTYAEKPDPYAGVNTATATWDGSVGTPHGTASNTADFTFDTGTPGNPTRKNMTVTVIDQLEGFTPITLGTVTAPASPSDPKTVKTFTYTRSLAVPQYDCKEYTNTAEIKETGQSDAWTVRVCGPVRTDARTIGFWQNKNGQGIIQDSGQTNGTCNLALWLQQFAPFQNMGPSGGSCSGVAGYVYNVIKEASSAGPTMNAMLKAQMLATALNVYFSDPALGGNKLKAPNPIGGVAIDLTGYSGAFGGATSMTVMEMLTYASGQSNFGGTTWYGNVKATQELAKNAFDAINNQRAFAP